jgi:endoglucanase
MSLLRSVSLTLPLLASLLALTPGCDDEALPSGARATGGSGGAGAAAAGGAGGAGATNGADGGSGSGAGLLIDDFEDGDGTSLIGGGWYVYTDNSNGGLSALTIDREGSSVAMTGPGFSSERSLLVDFTLDRGTLTIDPFVGLAVALPPSYGNLTEYGVLSYSYKGSAHEVRIETSNVSDYDYHRVRPGASEDWTTVELDFDQFAQGGWGERVPFAVEDAKSISWHVSGEFAKAVGTLQIDNVRLLPGGDEPLEPNLTIHAPAPPDPKTFDTIEITHPLQARAMESLDRGYNITNWLEQGRFGGYEYDESFVEKLALAGFQALRLPIDLDRYVEERTVEGEDVELVLHDDLFAVLDDFAAWTEKYGLSFTIDYHQYDRSFDFDDPVGAAELIALWSAVAEHFGANPREDLFYELMNEPELFAASGFTDDLTIAQRDERWTALAEEMVAAIRIHDADRAIIFGGADWYGIGPLSARAPLDDPNIIYAFHFYDPFIFTHQGASWAGMGATHDIPYPYSEDRWSEFMEDFGFSALNEAWQRSQLTSYFRNGNKDALRNRIASAKQWAVDHNVPIICNEFGVYEATSTHEDRTRYYTDLIDIFAELEIPWQIWFTIMDAETGAVDADYQTAFRLAE